MKRREVMMASAGALSAALLPTLAFAGSDKGRWRGTIGYFGEAGTRTGSEYFSVTRHGGGAVTLRAVCEMYDDDLVRDTILTLDANNRPTQAYLKTVENGARVGSAWYRFEAGQVVADIEGSGGTSSRQTMALDDAAPFFGTHSLVNDAWLARLMPPGQSRITLPSLLSTSLAANGGGVPGLYVTAADMTLMGEERVTVKAGTFDCTHYQVAYGDYPPLDMWVTGPEYLLALMSWSHLSGRYELLSLEHDPGA